MRSKEYVRPVSPGYWFSRPSWTRFMLREFTALFVAGYAIFLLVVVARARDAQSFSAFYEGLGSPLSILLHLIALAMVVYHAVTWFNATPQALIFWRASDRVGPGAIVSSQYIAWAILSLIVAGLALGLGG